MDSVTPSLAEHLSSDGKLAVPVDEAAPMLGIGRTMAYREVASGRLRSFRVGKRRLVPVSALVDYINDRMAEQEAS